MQAEADQGLRERKRRATASAIEEAAVRLVLEHGFGAVTIDEICSEANISRRTFFNYFPTKEAAVLGPAAENPDPEMARRFLSAPADDPASAIIDVAVTTLDKATTSEELLTDRIRLMGTDPDMLQAQLSRYDKLDEGLIALLVQHFEKFPETRRLEGVETLHNEARLIVAVMSGAMRYSMRVWLESGRGEGRSDMTRASIGLIHQLFGR